MSGVRWLILALALSGCGGPPSLPPAEASPGFAAAGDAGRGAALFADRGFGRSGLACADCHPHPGAGPRPGPALDRWAAGQGRWAGAPRSPAESLGACLERYGDRGPPSPAEAADLRAAAAGMALASAAPPAEPLALYRAACAGCHEQGPAGALVGRRWSAAAVGARVRARPALDEHMPSFAPAALPDAALAALAGWLAERPTPPQIW